MLAYLVSNNTTPAKQIRCMSTFLAESVSNYQIMQTTFLQAKTQWVTAANSILSRNKNLASMSLCSSCSKDVDKLFVILSQASWKGRQSFFTELLFILQLFISQKYSDLRILPGNMERCQTLSWRGLGLHGISESLAPTGGGLGDTPKRPTMEPYLTRYC